MLRRALVWGGAAVLCALVAVGCGGGGAAEGGGGEEGRYREEIVIGWTPPDITGVVKTATDFFEQAAPDANKEGLDRKSTRLNSSHANISYAVFCLKKKKK